MWFAITLKATNWNRTNSQLIIFLHENCMNICLYSRSFSLSYILNAMNRGSASKDNDNSKLFRIKLELWENQLRFVPSLTEENHNDSFIRTIKSLIRDICSVLHQIDRIAQPISECASKAQQTYQSKREVFR